MRRRGHSMAESSQWVRAMSWTWAASIILKFN